MAFGQQNRRFAGGSNFGRGGNNQSGPSRSGGQREPGNDNGGDRQKASKWGTICRLYDPWHSSMEPNLISEWIGTTFVIKLAPVFGEQRGPENEAGVPKYDHQNAATFAIKMDQLIVARLQLDAFMAGQMQTCEINTGAPGKRIILCRAEEYYEEGHPEFAEHAGGMALSIEQDATERDDARSVVFISRPRTVDLGEGGTVMLYPEFQVLLEAMNSTLANFARVDFNSCRLLENGSQGNSRPTGAVAPQPMRRGAAGPRTTANDPGPRSEDDYGDGVSDDDINQASGSGVRRAAPAGRAAPTQAASRPSMDDVLGGDCIPSF